MSYTKRQKFDAVVFDMDGVLFDTEHVLMECWQQIARKYGFGRLEEAYMASIGTDRRETERIFAGIYGEEFPYHRYKEEASKLYWIACEKGYPRMKPGVLELLNALREAEIPLALASSTSREIVMKELEAAELLPYFSYVICGDQVTRSKPDPQIYRLACEALGKEYGSCYAIEDSYNGIRSAAGAGMRSIMVPDMLPATEEMKELTETVAEDLIGVREYLLCSGL